MSPKKAVFHSDKVTATPRPRQSESKTSRPSGSQPHAAALLQRASLDPRALTPRDVLQLQRTVGNQAVGRLLRQVAQRRPAPKAANNTGLPENLKTGVESLSGLSLDDVKVHYNSSRPAELQALAYTQGADIHVAPGQERHLPHEAWHVVQQKEGRVKATLQTRGVSVNDDQGLEQEADLMGTKALQMGSSRDNNEPVVQPLTAAQPVETTVPARTSSIVQNVVQRATNLRFDAGVTGNSQITATQHNRSGVHPTAVDWVLTNGAWKTVPGGEVCNHSKDYDQMAQQILNAIHDETLSDAAGTVKTTHTTLKNKNQGIGAATTTHENRMDAVINHPNNLVNVDNMIDTFNYYIYKICDYPRNLFFWPDKTDGNPDEPSGEYGHDPTNDWKARNQLISDARRLREEKKRLRDARADLTAALP